MSFFSFYVLETPFVYLILTHPFTLLRIGKVWKSVFLCTSWVLFLLSIITHVLTSQYLYKNGRTLVGIPILLLQFLSSTNSLP